MAFGFMTTRLTHQTRIALRHCRLLLITLWAFTPVSWSVFAQPVENPVSQEIVTTPVPSTANPGPPATIAVRNPCDPDYWIVSSRRAKCDIQSGLPIEFDVIRFDGSNSGRSSSMVELQASLQPGVPVCFMAHGSFVTWESMLNDSAYTYRWLRQAAPSQPVHIIFYTWASDDGGLFTQFKVNRLGRRATLNGFYLADIIANISARHPVCLIGHSHGTRMVSSALHALAGGEIDGKILAAGPQPTRRIRVVFAAAAIDHDWLNPTERYGRALCTAEALINLRNKRDFPLLFYPLRRPLSTNALAISGVTRRDRAELGEWNQKVVDCEVTDLVRWGHIWSHYYNQPTIAAAIRHYVYFDEEQLAMKR